MCTETAERLLSEIDFAAVCGNAGEISTLASMSAEMRGVESIGGDAASAVMKAARVLGVTVAATEATDYVSDGERLLASENGHPLMGRIVASGCASTAVVGCFAAAVGRAGAGTVASALSYFGRAGEVAAGRSDGPGTFEPCFLDALVGDPSRLDGMLEMREIAVG